MNDRYQKNEERLAELSPLEYEVTQLGATEPPFDNEFWNHKEPGLYVDVVTGEALFASTRKYDSGTGWPSFTEPIAPANVVAGEGNVIFGAEVHSAGGESHLGHVFADGPADAGGLRYCINSAALRFVPLDRLDEEGYGEYRSLFEAPAGAGPNDNSGKVTR